MCFDKKSKIIDTSIYSEHWFRYPNQSKEGNELARHDIIKGDMIDFISEYISENSININDKPFIKIQENKFDDEFIMQDNVINNQDISIDELRILR